MLNIKKSYSLKRHNTFHVDVKADFFVEVFSENDVLELLKSDVLKTNKFLILGWGANILFTQDFAGLIIKVSIPGKEVISETRNEVIVKVGAGEDRHEFVLRCVEHNRCGAENLAYIPGQIGSAPVQNIWAYGVEAKDIISAVEGINIETWEKIVLTNHDCAFAYRDSIFKHQQRNKIIITAVQFYLQKRTPTYPYKTDYKDIQPLLSGQQLSLRKIMQTVVDIRKSKLPDRKNIWTAWSFFKNPVVTKDQYEKLLEKYPTLIWHGSWNMIKLVAGQLIELTGYKGAIEWSVGTYDKHALIIVNNGEATGQEIRDFAKTIQQKVLERFVVTLEPEVIVM